MLLRREQQGRNQILSTKDWVVHYWEDPACCSKRLGTYVLVNIFEANRYTPVGDSGRASSRGICPER